MIAPTRPAARPTRRRRTPRSARPTPRPRRWLGMVVYAMAGGSLLAFLVATLVLAAAKGGGH